MGRLAVEVLKFHSFGQYIMRLKLSLIYVFKGKKLHYICLTNELYVSYLFRHSLRKNLLGYYNFIFTGMCLHHCTRAGRWNLALSMTEKPLNLKLVFHRSHDVHPQFKLSPTLRRLFPHMRVDPTEVINLLTHVSHID